MIKYNTLLIFNLKNLKSRPEEITYQIRNRLDYAAILAAVTAVYLVAGKLGLKFAFVHESVTAIWPPTGIAIAVFILFGHRIWPGIFAGAFLVNITTAGNILTSLAIAAGNTLEGFLGMHLANRFAEGRKAFDKAQNAFRFIFFAGFAATAVAATVGTTSLSLGGFAPWKNYGLIWLTWWLGDMLGALLIAPLIILWNKKEPFALKKERVFELTLLAAALLLVASAAFLGFPFPQIDNLPIGFFTVPVLVWAAFRFGQRITITSSTAISLIALWGTLMGHGPFSRLDINESLLLLQAFIGTITTMALAINAISLEKSRNEEHARALLLSIGDGIIATDRQGRIITVNKVSEELLGWRAEESLGKHISEIISMETLEDEEGKRASIPYEKRPLGLAISLKRKITATHYLTKRGGTKFPAIITATPIEIRGSIVGAITVFHDISREKEIDRAKTEFIALAAHQLRTPLSIINWHAEVLLKKAGIITPENKKLYLGQIYRANQRMISLTNALLNVSRIERGAFIVEPVPTNIIEIAQGALEECGRMIEEKNLNVKKYYDKNLIPVNLDPDLTRIILTNLISNAVKYTPQEGSISIDVILETDRNSILIRVSDTGYGIPKHQQSEIFTKLFRADNIKEYDTDGSGLGLYIVKSILDRVGGRIWFESEEKKGSTFFVLLPSSGMPKRSGTRKLEQANLFRY